MRKKAELRVRNIANHYGWFKHKYGDVRYCIHCHMPLPKSENAPDFYIAPIGTWVEAKNNDSTGTWKCGEIMEGGARKNQREFLDKNGGWLFIELADGNAPKNADAYLVPWASWKTDIEPILNENDMKSIRRLTTYNKDGMVRRPGADFLLEAYQLKWESKTGWIIPGKHTFWKVYRSKLKEQLIFVNQEIANG